LEVTPEETTDVITPNSGTGVATFGFGNIASREWDQTGCTSNHLVNGYEITGNAKVTLVLFVRMMLSSTELTTTT
jgi:hypothetical protein